MIATRHCRQGLLFRSRFGWLAVCLPVGLVACASGGGDDSKAGRASATLPRVQAHRLATEGVISRRQWLATLQTQEQHELRAPLSGSVLRLDVEAGAHVRRGQGLVLLGEPGLEPRRAVMIERRDSLRNELERYRRLAESGAAGPGEVDSARDRLLQLEQSLTELEANLGNQRVVAPVAGIISALHTVRGDFVTVGEPLLTLRSAESPGLRVTLPSADSHYFADLGAIELQAEAFAADRLRPTRAIFHASSEPGFVEVELRVAGASGDIPTAVEVVHLSERESLVVPWTAVAADGDSHWVALLEESERGAILQRRQVQLGQAFSHGIEVRHGLVAGELLLAYEPRAFAPGSLLEPVIDQ